MIKEKCQHVALIAIETKNPQKNQLKLILFKNTNKYNHLICLKAIGHAEL